MTNARADAEQRITLSTRFGDFESDPRELVTFPSGLPGFEACRQFVLLSSSTNPLIQCLHAVDGPPASFLVVDPRRVLADYRCQLEATDARRFGAGSASALLWLAILSFDDRGAAFANLRAPIVVDPQRMVGFQLVPHRSTYPLRQPFSLG